MSEPGEGRPSLAELEATRDAALKAWQDALVVAAVCREDYHKAEAAYLVEKDAACWAELQKVVGRRG